MRKPRRNGQAGFALLFVYAMAATVAIMLYMELPRVAFEAQRDKEQLLIDRGEQYTRAINLYVRKFNRFPSDFEALQNTQNLRFLRHKYVDPMTGKEEWRIIHVGPGGVFTDSLLYGKKKDDKKTEQQTFITEMQQIGGNQTTGNQGVNLAARQRPSDQAGAPGDPNNPNANNVPQPGFPGGQTQGIPTSQVAQFDPTGQLVNNNVIPTANNGQFPPSPGSYQPSPNGFQPGAPTQPGAPQGVQLPPGFNIQQGANPVGFPGQQGGPPAAAANLINQILTTPRPGGLNGLNNGFPQATVDQNGNPVPNAANNGGLTGQPQAGTQPQGITPAATTGQTIGGGIAGVASKLEQDGIKSYRDRTAYNEWEFVYDITKDPARGGGQQIPTQQTGTGNAAGNAGAGAAVAPH